MHFDRAKLRLLVALAEEQSFTSAADRMNISQSSISVQLRRFEEALDMVLVDRGRGKFNKLTANGEELVEIARRYLKNHDDTARDLRALRDRGRNRLALGVDAATLYMPERNRLIADFIRIRPGIDLEVVNEQPSELFKELDAGRLDLLLTLCPGAERATETMPLYEYELKLFVPKSIVNAPRFNRPEGVSDTEVLVLPDDYHPAFFDWLRTSLAPAGFRWKICPEVSFHALMRYAVSMQLPTLAPDFTGSMPELRAHMEQRAMKIPRPAIARWALMAGGGVRRRTASSFWKLASESAASSRPNVAQAGIAFN